MRRKIILKCALIFVLLLDILRGVDLTALAADKVTVQVKDVIASAGQTVTTELIMDGTFAAFQGVLMYDTGALTLEKIEATSLLSGSITVFTQDETTGTFVNGSFVSASANNAVVDGAVLAFTFRAGSNANGTYSFSIEQLLIYDEEGVSLTVDAVDTIVVPATPHSTTPEPAPTTQKPAPAPTTQEPTPALIIQESAPAPTTQKPALASTSNDPDRGHSDGSGSVILLLIIAAIVLVGIVLTAIRIKKNKMKAHEQQK
ncbi:MAG: hypothetical protein LBK75_08345 [Oscillospiraceae bacterium]|nr:hypothetical protein [Oscillospiraceae bacterium]